MQRRDDPEHDRETRRRYDREQLLRAGGPEGRRMIGVVDAVAVLSREQCERLAAAFRGASDSRKGDLEQKWSEAFRYAWPYPQHPADLYAVDPLSRAVLTYAGLVARERTGVVMGAAAPEVGLVERAAIGAVLALAADRAHAGGWYMPVPAELVPLLRQPWTDVMGPPAEARPAEADVGSDLAGAGPLMASHLCREDDLRSPAFRRWAEAIRPAWDLEGGAPAVNLHRKLWEWLFVIQALDERGMLQSGRRGLGFGVGIEPLVSYFAHRGCNIVATDLDPLEAEAGGWGRSNQYAGALDGLNRYGLCDADRFRTATSFRIVNMNSIPRNLRHFDFNWSSCAFEHLGSIEQGIRFIIKQMDTLRPGGVAVHTTEFNVGSGDDTVESGGTVIFRRRDIQEMASLLRRAGHRVECDFSEGDGAADRHVDVKPYTGTHLRVLLSDHIATSFGLIIEKGSRGDLARARFRAVRGARPPAPADRLAIRPAEPANRPPHGST